MAGFDGGWHAAALGPEWAGSCFTWRPTATLMAVCVSTLPVPDPEKQGFR